MDGLTRTARGLAAAGCALMLAAALTACTSAEDRKRAYAEKAEALVAEGEFEKARLELRNAIKIDPKDLDVRLSLAKVMLELQRWRGAAGQLQHVTRGDKSNVEARLLLAKLYLSARAKDKARELLDEALALAPDNPLALALEGRLAGLDGDLAAAAAAADAALAADPDSRDAILLSSQVRLSQGDTAGAIAQLESALERHPQDLELKVLLAGQLAAAGQTDAAAVKLQEVIASTPGKSTYRVELARLYLREGRIDDAEPVLVAAARAEPDDVTSHLALAEFQTRYRSWKQAETTLIAYSDLHPKAFKARFALAKLYTAAGQPDRAKTIYTEITQLDNAGDAAFDARAKLASLLAAGGELDAAREQVRLSLEGNPRHLDTMVVRAKLAILEKRFDDAVADLRLVLRDRPRSAEILGLLGRVHLAKNEVALAEDYLEQAVQAEPDGASLRILLARLSAATGDLDAAAAQLESGLERAPDDRAMLQSLAQLQIGRGQWDAALDTAERLKKSYPEKPHGAYMAGRVSYARKNYENAAAELSQAMAIVPDSGLVLAALSASLVALEREDDALAAVDAFLERSPQAVDGLRLRAGLLTRKGDFDRAHAAYERLLAAVPEDVGAWRGLAFARVKLGRSDDAATAMRDGIEATGHAFELVSQLAGFYESTGEAQAAIDLYDAHLDRHPDSLLAVNNLAMTLVTYEGEGRLDRAGVLVERLLDAKTPALLDTVGWVYHKRGDNRRAIPVLEQVVESAPDVPIFRYHLAVAYQEDGRDGRALAELKRLVSDEKANFPEMEDARLRLEQLTKS